ncbi:dicarboxylate/amino acid:cation symporter [Flavobacterium sp. WLB]|uniref:dicarboxylate/amino acid:cation symporter n=1 Tax=unclassified Flavobacterium TaxID=196869 RepID=UPI0006ABBDED|nr:MULTISPECIES: dicarboxylate/amino acid:cation symporter [unclassified Flavobacterium]KOP40263.1 sodium:proton antiporter [Flavobacterium sp. VMW]OWU91348.1 sodium:proton antiporter [Flavobacterium sp. NLM]PUU71101.1 dicarboxylate/amino acid:cation symporter [Flavobacterium sp. WLB]
MEVKKINFLQNYSSILLLLGGIIIGSIFGLVFGEKVLIIKPIGDIFLNLLFTAIIPLIFFTIGSSIANLERTEKLGKLFVIMILVFLATILISGIVMICAVYLFPIHQDIAITKVPFEKIESGSAGDQIAKLLTANDFFELLSRKSMLALIIFSFLIGFATLQSGEKGKAFKSFLDSGNEVMKQLLNIIMKFAPLGLGAYFAYQVGIFGPQLFGVYAKPMAVYYAACIFYFFVFFSLYAFVSGGKRAFKVFWSNNITPSLTAVGTCSSIATIPANLDAAQKMGIPSHVRNLVIPLGAPLHKDGSSMSSILKITFLFAMFGKDFTDPMTILLALGITVVVSIVEGGIPNGGYIGEILAITVYGFPMEQALPVAMILGTLVDPIATLLNANGDVICSMMVSRFSEKTKW